MVNCWASSLGGCSGKQSLEHFLSEGIWDSNSVGVAGLFSEEHKVIGFGSLGANVLCTKHNNDQSELDAEIRTISDRVHRFYRYFAWRSKAGTNLQSVVEFRIRADLLERWMLKFLIGLFCAIGKDSFWYDNGSKPISPPERLVEFVFNRQAVERPIGLYLAYGAGDKHQHLKGTVDVETHLHPNGGFVGANVDLNGIRFIVWLSEIDLESFWVKSSSGTIFGPGKEPLMYHPKIMNFKNAKQRIKFLWPD